MASSAHGGCGVTAPRRHGWAPRREDGLYAYVLESLPPGPRRRIVWAANLDDARRRHGSGVFRATPHLLATLDEATNAAQDGAA